MLCYLINIKRSNFFYKKPTDDNLNYFWIVTVQDWYRTSPAIADCPLVILHFWNVIDIDFLLVKKSKICCVFDNQRIKLAKNGKVLFTEHSQRKLKWN